MYKRLITLCLCAMVNVASAQQAKDAEQSKDKQSISIWLEAFGDADLVEKYVQMLIESGALNPPVACFGMDGCGLVPPEPDAPTDASTGAGGGSFPAEMDWDIKDDHAKRTSVPEPASLFLFVLGLAGIGFSKTRARQ